MSHFWPIVDNEMAESACRDAVGKAIENCLAPIRLEAEKNIQESRYGG